MGLIVEHIMRNVEASLANQSLMMPISEFAVKSQLRLEFTFQRLHDLKEPIYSNVPACTMQAIKII